MGRKADKEENGKPLDGRWTAFPGRGCHTPAAVSKTPPVFAGGAGGRLLFVKSGFGDCIRAILG